MNSWSEAIPWILAAAGWGATHLFSEARERRKEVRAQLDKTLERLSKIEESARDFHCSETFDLQTSLRLISEIGRLERAVERISRFKLDDFTAIIIAHKRAITLKNFESSSFKQHVSNSELLMDISTATYDFEDEIERRYRNSYPSKFPYFKIFD